jgi:hypothetical protein
LNPRPSAWQLTKHAPLSLPNFLNKKALHYQHQLFNGPFVAILTLYRKIIFLSS